MAPDRSTTLAGTSRIQLRSLVAAGCAVVLIGIGISGAVVLTRTGVPPTVAIAADAHHSAEPLVVGDGRTVRMLSLGGARTDPLLARIATQIGEATNRVEQFWGADWSRDIVVVATDSDEQFQSAAPGAPTGMAAVAVADEAGQRIVMAPGADRMSDHALRIVLSHELFHYAARTATAVDAPRWLTEGVADHVARGGDPVPPVPIPTRFPTDADFDTNGPALSTAYDQAWLLCRFIAERYGQQRLRELYRQVAGTDHDGRSFEDAVRSVVGVDSADVLSQWQQWLAAHR